MLEITTLSAGWQTFFYAAAMVLLGLRGVGFKEGTGRLRPDALGLALFVFVFFWNALAAT